VSGTFQLSIFEHRCEQSPRPPPRVDQRPYGPGSLAGGTPTPPKPGGRTPSVFTGNSDVPNPRSAWRRRESWAFGWTHHAVRRGPRISARAATRPAGDTQQW